MTALRTLKVGDKAFIVVPPSGFEGFMIQATVTDVSEEIVTVKFQADQSRESTFHTINGKSTDAKLNSFLINFK